MRVSCSVNSCRVRSGVSGNARSNSSPLAIWPVGGVFLGGLPVNWLFFPPVQDNGRPAHGRGPFRSALPVRWLSLLYAAHRRPLCVRRYGDEARCVVPPPPARTRHFGIAR